MSGVVVVGAQWGDEGKGKVVDHYSRSADVVVRFGGGANAGHTLVLGDDKLVTHLIPSGVLHPGKKCVLGRGMVLDLATLTDEIGECRQKGLLAKDELLISGAAHVVMPYHRMIEQIRESGAGAIGTTRRGIGPTYESKAGRRGLRVLDLQNRELSRAIVAENCAELAPRMSEAGLEVPSKELQNRWVDEAAAVVDGLSNSIGDAGRYVEDALSRGDNVLFEGAQGALLDLDHGTYPFVTSSSTIAAGASQGVGIGPRRIDRVIGISKAYCTRVGAGPFPSEMSETVAEAWRTAGAEFGATTGRPRRCGWLDLAALKLAVRLSSMDELALTKLDVLSGRGAVQVCTGYRIDGRVVDELPDIRDGRQLEPVFEQFEGWGDIDAEGGVDGLPPAARAYIAAIEKALSIPVTLISVGPERSQTIDLGDPFRSS